MSGDVQEQPRSANGNGVASTFQWLGLIFGALSIITLVTQALQVDLSSPFETLLDYYERALGVLLGWMKAPLTQLAGALHEGLGLDLILFPAWKHVFVLLAVTMTSVARVRFKGSWRAGTISLGLALVLSLVFSVVGAGIVVVEEGFWSPAYRVFLLLYPLFALYVFEILSFVAIVGTMERMGILVLRVSVFGLVVMGVLTYLRMDDVVKSIDLEAATSLETLTPIVTALNIVITIPVVAAYALSLMLVGLLAEVPILHRYFELADDTSDLASDSGLMILLSFVAAAIFLVTNAGLNLLGL